MAPENNSDLNQDSVTKTEDTSKPISDISAPSSSSTSSSDDTNTITGASNDDVVIKPTNSAESSSDDSSTDSKPSLSSTPSPPDPSGPKVDDNSIADAMAHMDKTEASTSTPEMTKPAKSGMFMKVILALILAILVIGGVAALAYHEGKGKTKIIYASPAPKPISLPATAIVTNACVPGRGKQYIIPKDIPQGPIYDVVNSKVIAIEYLISVQELLGNSSQFSAQFSNIILSLSKNYPVDHFALVPAAPPTGQTGNFINLIMFVVSPSVANSITCPGTSSTSTVTGSSTSTSTTTPSTTTTTTTPSTTTTTTKQ